MKTFNFVNYAPYRKAGRLFQRKRYKRYPYDHWKYRRVKKYFQIRLKQDIKKAMNEAAKRIIRQYFSQAPSTADERQFSMTGNYFMGRA